MNKKDFKCTIEHCGEKEEGGTIKGKPYCKHHFNKFVLTAPLVREQEKVNRNEKCPCGSGKKFKNCCMNRAKKSYHFYNNKEELVL